jgi:ParB family chromosome partitioning protein
LRRGIGKGLAQLATASKPAKATKRPSEKPAAPTKAAVTPRAEEPKRTSGATEIPVSQISPNKNQPRTQFFDESLQQLAESIQSLGVIQPIIVRRVGDNKYEIIAGERRFRASQLAGLQSVPAVVHTTDAQVSLEMALVENIQREDISAMEMARAYQQLMEEFGLTQEQVAKKVGKGRSAVANTLRLLRLPKYIQDAIEAGNVTEGQVRPLLSLPHETAQRKVFDLILSQELSARRVEALVQELLSPTPAPEKESVKIDPDWVALESGLSKYFGSQINLKRGKVGGQMVVHFHSDEDLQRILDILGMSL